ncbi:unnamed protein product, partial [Ixodes pacificus]
MTRLAYSRISLIRTRLIQTFGLFELTLWSGLHYMYFNGRKRPVIRTLKRPRRLIRTSRAAEHAFRSGLTHAAVPPTSPVPNNHDNRSRGDLECCDERCGAFLHGDDAAPLLFGVFSAGVRQFR